MSLTEVVYKIRSGAFPLCQLTEEHEDLRIVVNQLTWDTEAGEGSALLTILGPETVRKDVVGSLGAIFDDHEIVPGEGSSDRSIDHLNVRVTETLERMHKTQNPMAFTLQYFGESAIIEPALIQDGHIMSRVLAPFAVDLANLLKSYEEGVEEGLWDDFKLMRIEDFNPEEQTHGAFSDNLTQKQLEVIKTALALGFYNTPRDVTLDDLSNIFGISKAAVHNRLQAAERKVISKFFS